MKIGPVLVTGSTGYVGGRLVPLLLSEGYRVRAMGRTLAKLAARSWARHPMVELVEADVTNLESLKSACRGCWAAYYLVHSMNPITRDFARTDRQAAENMVAAAADAEMERIIYLGGIVPTDGPLSPHLASRAEVGRILAAGPVPATILRAAMILGSGSASFEIMRYLLERLPIMFVPRQVKNLVQPICIRNVLGYLAGCLEHKGTAGQTYDICGPDILSYIDLFQMYALEAGLGRRWISPVPFITPRMLSYLIHLITPVHASLAQPLAEGLKHTVICTDHRLKSILPQDLMDCRRTFRRIMVKEQQQIVETSWTDAGLSRPHEWVQAGDAEYAGGTVISRGYDICLTAGPEKVWDPLVKIGGNTGWYYADFLWRLRGWADKVVGGAGSGRGRRHQNELAVGDVLDFWRVIDIKTARRLVLMSEMKTPGEMVLDFRLSTPSPNETHLRMIARFLPKGLWGLIYWYALLPFHIWLYKGVLKAMSRRVGAGISAGPAAFKPSTPENGAFHGTNRDQ